MIGVRRRLLLVALLALVAGCGSAGPPGGPLARQAAGTRSESTYEDADDTTTATVTTTTTTPATTTTTSGALGQLGPPVGPVVDASRDSACGTEQWALKTLQDPGSAQVQSTPVVISGVAQLNAVPDAGAGSATRMGIELHTYQLTGTLVAAKQEADSDLHVILRDASGRTVVAELPSSACVKDAAPAAQADMNSARAAFLASCGQPSSGSFKALSGSATVVGVGFYDFDHGQAYKDALGDGFDVELHPVLSFSGGCR